MLTRLAGTVRALLRRRRDEQDLDEELRAYLDAAVDDELAGGMARDDAVREARAEMGSMTATRDAVREAGWEAALDTVVQDLRYAAHALTRNPGFTLAAALTLALGIGANTAIFSIVNALFIRPLADEVRMRLVHVTYAETLESRTSRFAPAMALFEEWERENDVFDGMAMERYGQLTLVDISPVERVTVLAVSPQWHRIFGGAAVQGRLFTPDDAGQPVMVISESAWRTRFGSDRAVIGRTVQTAEGSRTVIGVVRGEFSGHSSIEFWTPFEADDYIRRMSGWGGALTARLKPGVTVEQAQSRMRALRWDVPHPRMLGPGAVAGVAVESLHDGAVESTRVMLMVLAGAVGFILLIACVNVAGLVVARGANRTREIAVRAALGAGRRRIVRQLLTESVALAVLGGSGGAVLAFWSLDAVVGVLPLSVPAELEPRVDLTVLAFTLAASIVTGLLFGLFPACRMSKPHVVVDLKDGGHVTQSWTRRTAATLIVVETALAFVLLTGAGLMIQSLRNVLAIDPGFDPDRVLVVEAAPVVLGDGAAERSSVFYLDLLERIRRLPGVDAVGGIDFLPFEGYALSVMEVDGPAPRRTDFGVRFTLPGYFEAMGIPLVAGRGFAATDRDGAPCVAMVNQKAAREVCRIGVRSASGSGGLASSSGARSSVSPATSGTGDSSAMWTPRSISPRCRAASAVHGKRPSWCAPPTRCRWSIMSARRRRTSGARRSCSGSCRSPTSWIATSSRAGTVRRRCPRWGRSARCSRPSASSA